MRNLKDDLPEPVYLLGATSIVGYNVILQGGPRLVGVVTSRLRHPVLARWPRLSLAEESEIAAFCLALPPGAIILYCDAVCDVSKCEHNPAWAREINVGNLRRFLNHLPGHARLIYVSSDHVFGEDGTYTEASTPCPVSLYGAIRAEAEQLALTRPGALLIRAGLPIGPSLDGKSGHLDWLRYRLAAGLPVTIVKDESRTALPSALLGDRIIALGRSSLTGIRHISATRLISRPDLAHALKAHFKFQGEVNFATRADQPAPHLGRIHIQTEFTDAFAQPLPSPVELLGLQDDIFISNNPPTSFAPELPWSGISPTVAETV